MSLPFKITAYKADKLLKPKCGLSMKHPVYSINSTFAQECLAPFRHVFRFWKDKSIGFTISIISHTGDTMCLFYVYNVHILYRVRINIITLVCISCIIFNFINDIPDITYCINENIIYNGNHANVLIESIKVTTFLRQNLDSPRFLGHCWQK